MSWRDFIVTSRHTPTESNPLTKGDSVDIVDIVLFADLHITATSSFTTN